MAKGKNTKKKEKKYKENKNIKKIDGIGGLDSEIWSKIFIVIIVFVVLGLFYLLTLYITNKDSKDNNKKDNSSETKTSISYDNILLGSSFSMSDEDYLVIYYDKSNEELSNTYSSLVSNYGMGSEGAVDTMKIYTVDMSSAFNKTYITTEEPNRFASNASELLINGPTLIHFSNHAIAEYMQGEDEITSYLSQGN